MQDQNYQWCGSTTINICGKKKKKPWKITCKNLPAQHQLRNDWFQGNKNKISIKPRRQKHQKYPEKQLTVKKILVTKWVHISQHMNYPIIQAYKIDLNISLQKKIVGSALGLRAPCPLSFCRIMIIFFRYDCPSFLSLTLFAFDSPTNKFRFREQRGGSCFVECNWHLFNPSTHLWYRVSLDRNLYEETISFFRDKKQHDHPQIKRKAVGNFFILSI